VKSYSGFRIQNGAEDDYIIDAAELERRTEILESHDFGDLLSRPVQAKMFCEMFLDKFVSPRPYLTGELYEIFVRRIIEREIDKRKGSPFKYAARRKFAESIAWWLWTTAQTMSVDESKIPDELVRPFAPNADIELDAVRRDLVSACFLERKGNKTLFFPHRSFQEFLVASHLVKSEIDDMKLVFVAATRDVSRFVSEIPEGAATFERWHAALPHHNGVMSLNLLKDIARSMKDQGKQRQRVQCPWDIPIQFLISCRSDDDQIKVNLLALDAVFKSWNFFSEYNERSICVDVLLVAIAHAAPDLHSVISNQIFGLLINYLQLKLGTMPGTAAMPRFSPSMYLDRSRSDPYWHIVRRSINLTPGVDGSIEAKYTPHELIASVQAHYPSFRIVDIEGLERVPEQIITIPSNHSHPYVKKNRLTEVLAVLGLTGCTLIAPKETVPTPILSNLSARDIANGPHIETANLENVRLQSPLHFNLSFRPSAGTSIDLDSLAVSYLRGSIPDIDLTERTRLFARPTGIDILYAEVPVGEHAIRVHLKDSDGRTTIKTFVLVVVA
jgi:hypothetical protein